MGTYINLLEDLYGRTNMTLVCCLCICSDLSNNGLSGDIPVNGSFSLFTPIRLMIVTYWLFLFTNVNLKILTLLLPSVLLVTSSTIHHLLHRHLLFRILQLLRQVFVFNSMLLYRILLVFYFLFNLQHKLSVRQLHSFPMHFLMVGVKSFCRQFAVNPKGADVTIYMA